MYQFEFLRYDVHVGKMLMQGPKQKIQIKVVLRKFIVLQIVNTDFLYLNILKRIGQLLEWRFFVVY